MADEDTHMTKTLYAFIILFVLAVAVLAMVPSFLKAREPAYSAAACINNLRIIDSGKEQAALAERWTNGVDCDVSWNTMIINQYIKGNTSPECPDGGVYSYRKLGEDPVCSLYDPKHAEFRSHRLGSP